MRNKTSIQKCRTVINTFDETQKGEISNHTFKNDICTRCKLEVPGFYNWLQSTERLKLKVTLGKIEVKGRKNKKWIELL